MNKEPETYEDLIRYKRCVDLTKHYQLTSEEVNQIYEFLKENAQAKIIGNKTTLTLTVNYKPEIPPITINSKCIDSSIDGLKLTNLALVLIPHYTAYSSSSGGYSSGGGSSNNNNNNNNNNNDR